MEEFKPCPVCGSTDLHYYEEGLARRDEDDFWFVDTFVSQCLECNKCRHVVKEDTYYHLIDTWNKGEISEWEKIIKVLLI